MSESETPKGESPSASETPRFERGSRLERTEGPRPSEVQIALKLRSAHDDLVNVASSAGSIDIRSFEGVSAAEIYAGLEPVTVSHLQKALEHTRTIFTVCDQWEQKTAPGTSPPISADRNRDYDFEIDKLVLEPIENQSLRDNVADIAFIAKSELNERLARLQTLSPLDDSWTLLAEYDSALRRIRKSLAAVEYVLCKSEALPLCLDFQTEIEVSLLVRRAYVRLRRSLAGSQSPTEESIYGRMRAAGTQIAVLVGRDVYPLLRVRDRAQLRDVQSRILEWMRLERDNPRAGMRVWQDMAGVIDMFCQVSNRQELVDHDTENVEQIHRHLQANTQPQLPDQTISLLQVLEGLDPEVDELLASERLRDPAAWKAPIERLMMHFGLSGPKSTPSPSIMDDGDFF